MPNQHVAAILVSALVFIFGVSSLTFEESPVTLEEEEAGAEQENVFLGGEKQFDDEGYRVSHIVLVSTMDGKITALDVNADGAVLWTVNADASPLLSGTFSAHQKMQETDLPYTLVPSLDGSLFMFDIGRGLLHPVPLTSDISRMVNDVAVSGGSLNSKTGVDPVSGEIKYRCTSGKCERKVSASASSQTLVVSRKTQVARAADPLTGVEKWNLSVGEYMMQLVEANGPVQRLSAHVEHNVNFRLKPPDGLVSAYVCGHKLWEQRLSSPIARVWELAEGHLEEVSLFDSNNVEALSNFGQECEGNERLSRFETPFYIGFYNSELYIIPSEKSRAQKYFLHPSHASELIHRGSLFLHDRVLVELFKRKYQSRLKEIGMATEAPKRITFIENCPADESIVVPVSKEVECAVEKDELYGGWYVFSPIVNPQHMLMDSSSQPKSNVRGTSKEQCIIRTGIVKKLEEKLKVTELVSGWWRLVAITVMFVFCSSCFVFATKFREIRDNLEIGENLITKLNSFYGLQRLKIPMRGSFSTIAATGSISAVAGGSDSSLTPQVVPSTPFVSKFLEDFVPEKCLGRGGYGVVFNCRHKLDDRNYAVKRVTVSNTPSAIERVKREAKAMAKLDHPGIIRYFHTWIEKPPAGWQQTKDKQILEQMRHGIDVSSLPAPISCSKLSDANLSVLTTENGDSIMPSACKKATFGLEEHCNSKSASVSWAFSDSSAVFENVSSSSDFETSYHKELVAAFSGHSESDSSSVVFAKETESVNRENCERKSSSSEPLEPPLVLVAKDTDLQTCKEAKDYIYLYIQMELCQELTLHNWLLKNKTGENRVLNQMRNWFTQLLCAVGYIHDQGLIHRDIKPQNIFFSADGQGILKIGDLGLATSFDVVEGTTKKMQSLNVKSHTGNVGTKLYMSPEQLKGQPYNQKVDVFSLGLIFAEMLVPFQTVMERHEALTAVQNGALPENYLANSPKEREFILWLTAADPKLRPTCLEVMQCVYLKDEVIFVSSQFRPDRSRASSNNDLIIRNGIDKN